MVKKKILVTGGSGYIGARLCLHLANEGYEITCLCHSKIPSDENWVSKMHEVLAGDVRDESLLMKLAENKYDVLVHLVSLDHNQSNGSPSLVSSVNIAPVWSLLEIFSTHGLGKFIYFSTTQTYGVLQNEIVTEKRKLNTKNAYGLTHHIGEVICEHYNRTTAVDCRVIRLSNSYGAPILEENNCWWLVVNDLCRMAYLKKEIVLQSDGSPLRDFIHGWDVCQAIQKIIASAESHHVYNLSSGVTLSIMDIALKVQQVYKKKYGISIPLFAKPIVEKKKEPYHIDNTLLKSIGFEFQWSIEDGINDLFDYLEYNHKS